MGRSAGISRAVAVAALCALIAVGVGRLAVVPAPGRVLALAPHELDRFATVTFGDRGGRAAIESAATVTDDGDGILPPQKAVPSPVTEYRTPNGWLLRPAGTQYDVQRAPTGVTVAPDKKTVFVVTSGVFNEHLEAIDAETGASTTTPVGSLYMGVAADANNNVWASGGYRNKVYQFLYDGPVAGGLRQVGPAPGSPDEGIDVIGYPGNMVLSNDGRLFVVGNLSVPNDEIKNFDPKADQCPDSSICSVVNVIDVSGQAGLDPEVHVFPVGRDAYGIAFHPKAKKVYVTNWGDDTNPARGGGRGTLSIVDVSKPTEEKEIAVVPVGHHPTGIALSPNNKWLAVVNSADDTVTIMRLNKAGLIASQRTVSAKTTRGAPRGATPLSVSFGPNSKRLFVGLAGQNAIEMRHADGRPIPRRVKVGAGKNATALRVPHTYIPTGWYPSAMDVGVHPSIKQRRLYVTNLKGIGAGPGLNGQAEPLTGQRTQGTLSAIDLSFGSKKNKGTKDTLDALTARVVENNDWVPLFDRRSQSAAKDPCTPAPLPDGKSTFSQLLCNANKGKVDPRQFHVVYIVKENKTFDQYFGDINTTLPDADADPTWLLYGSGVTTNQHNLANQFALLDNFWADSEQSTTGHSWTSAGYATEFNEITWNPEYSQTLRGNRWGGQYSGQTSGPTDEEVAETEGELFRPEERLVDLFAEPSSNPSGATFRIYSDDVNPGTKAEEQRIPLGLWGIGDSVVQHGRDLDFPDTDRANIFLDGETISHAWSVCGVPCTGPPNGPPPSYGQKIELTPEQKQQFTLKAWQQDYEDCRDGGRSDAICQRQMPNFLYVSLPVDHTLGFNPEMPTPASMVANNDQAVGMIIDRLSKSPFWKTTLVMITEDDTQAAGDHVDAHRTFLLTAGGLSTTPGADGHASHQAGSFPSILKTIEVLFRLPALTIYDRAAVPLHDVVADSLKDTNNVEFTGVDPPVGFRLNPRGTVLAKLSKSMNWDLDMGDPGMLRDLLYHGIRGWPLPQRYYEMLERSSG